MKSILSDVAQIHRTHNHSLGVTQTQTTDIGSKMKLRHSRESPPSDDTIDLRLRFFIRSVMKRKINKALNEI